MRTAFLQLHPRATVTNKPLLSCRPAEVAKEPAQHAHLALENLTHNTLARRFHRAGTAAAIEVRVQRMGPGEAEAAREKAAEDARKRGAWCLLSSCHVRPMQVSKSLRRTPPSPHASHTHTLA